MQKTNLNLIPGGVLPVVNVSQYDEGRQFQLAIYDGASAYDLTDKTVTILVGKTDGNGCAYGATDEVNNIPVISVSGNIVTVTTPMQMTAAAGDNMAELRIEDANADIRTLNFILRAESAALSPDTPISDTEIPAIEAAGWAAVVHYPQIDPVTNHWLVWSVEYHEWVDTGVSAGGGGVSDYNDLTSRPQINDVLLTGNRSASALGLATDDVMTGATSGAAGGVGLVPAPAAGDQAKSLRGDGTWKAEIDTLSGLTDTTINSPTDGQILKYDADTSKWINSNGGGGGAGALADLSDVNLGTLANGEPLTYDSNDGKWVNGGIIPTSNGGTGNANGYIQKGQISADPLGTRATAEGYLNSASGTNCHVEGSANSATGQQAHAEGNNNSAAGNNAHVEGANNYATGACSHVGGRDNEAGYSYQTVIGKYNRNASDSLFEVGNGTGTALANRSNAIAVKEDGRITKNLDDAFPAASNIAVVEMTRTMTAQRVAGSYVYVTADDKMYKVTTTIAANGTLTPGTNATAAKIGDELFSISSDLANITNALLGVKVIVYDNGVSANNYIDVPLTAWETVLVISTYSGSVGMWLVILGKVDVRVTPIVGNSLTFSKSGSNLRITASENTNVTVIRVGTS